MSRQRPLTYAQCHALFDLPVAQAAAVLGVSRPTISKVLRAHGVSRWPYRKLKAQRKLELWKSRREGGAEAVVRGVAEGLDFPEPDEVEADDRKRSERTRQTAKRRVKTEVKVEKIVGVESAAKDGDNSGNSGEQDEMEQISHAQLDADELLAGLDATSSAGSTGGRAIGAAFDESSLLSTRTADGYFGLYDPLHTDEFPSVLPCTTTNWECTESLGDEGRAFTVTTNKTIHRAVLGDSSWSRGEFEMDENGDLTFRFVASDESLSISESELYAAVGRDIEVPRAIKE